MMEHAKPLETRQIPVDETLDVQAVEHELSELWTAARAGHAGQDESGALMRARVLNLMVYVTDEAELAAVDRMLAGVTTVHPCRALVMLSEPAAEDKDIEMFVSSRCQTDEGAGEKELSCEQVTMVARGRFAVELPSASVPLLVSDLPVFLWWRGAARFEDESFQRLSRVADRVVIDSARFENAVDGMAVVSRLLQQRGETQAAVSDLNWGRLTAWRTLLASFYDVPEQREALAQVNRVRIEYAAPEDDKDAIAPRALMLCGWLASRLGWRVAAEQEQQQGEGAQAADGADARVLRMEKDGRRIAVTFERIEQPGVAPGGLARVELNTGTTTPKSFIAKRAAESRVLETQISGGEGEGTERALSCGDKTEVQLFCEELEILSHDIVYEQALTLAAAMLAAMQN